MAPESVEPRVGVLARRLVRALTERTRQELGVAGFPDLRPVHNLVFALVEGGGARITDMAAQLGMTKQAVTLMVDYLEGRGYVTREDDPRDRRAKLVELTERGRAAARASLDVVERIERDWVARLGRDRMTTLKQTLAELVRSLAPPPDGTGPGPGMGQGAD